VKFWDTSALAPLCVDEPATGALRQLLSEDGEVAVWMLTSVELMSVVARLGRSTGELDDVLPGIRIDASERARRCFPVTQVDAVRRRAERLVGIHPLSAADALQLAAALVASQDRPETLAFVTLDRVLAKAARLEGFHVVPG